MEEILKQFEVYFEEENKESAVKYIMSKLEGKELDVIDLYCNILTPLLNHMKCKVEDKHICIWKEHVKTAIARTITECCYPYVIAKRDQLAYPKQGVAAVLCPPEEYHDLGARMVADFLTIAGYDAIFIGSNTPYQDFYHAVSTIKPEIIAISVSNYYNLVATKKMIEELRNVVDTPLKIIVGGHAFQEDESKYRMVGADYYTKNYEDIIRLRDGGVIK